MRSSRHVDRVDRPLDDEAEYAVSRHGGDEFRFGPVSSGGHAEVAKRPRKTLGTYTSANYNPVAEAEAILASEALQVAA